MKCLPHFAEATGAEQLFQHPFAAQAIGFVAGLEARQSLWQHLRDAFGRFVEAATVLPLGSSGLPSNCRSACDLDSIG